MYYHSYMYSYYPYPINVPIYYDVSTYDYHGIISDAKEYGFVCYSAPMALKDYGSKPFVVNINEAAKQNRNYRTALWTGEYLQVTLMSINVGEDIGLEVHPTVDQFLRIEEGQGLVQMGDKKDHLYFKENVYDDDAIMVPAGTWHNIINIGNKPLKLYSIYAPPNHPFGTVHQTKADAMKEEVASER